MSKIPEFAPVTADEIAMAIEQDEAARQAERDIKQAGIEAAAAVPRRIFRTVARDNELRAQAYSAGVAAAAHNKDNESSQNMS